jgi:hypothetical protein
MDIKIVLIIKKRLQARRTNHEAIPVFICVTGLLYRISF